MNFLKNFDQFALPIVFSYKGKEKYTSTTGLFLTFFLSLFSIFVLIFISQDLIFRKNPKVTEYESFEPNNSFKFSKNNVFLALAVHSKKIETEFINKSIYQVQANYYSKVNNTVKYQTISVKPCTKKEIEEFDVSKKYFENKNYWNYYCFSQKDYKNLSLIGAYDDEEYQGVEIYFNSCVENCSSKNVTKEYMKLSWIEIFLIDAYIDPLNYSHPKQYKTGFYTYFLPENTIKSLELYFQNIYIETDIGWIFNEINKKEYGKLFSIKSENIKSDLNTFCYIILQQSKNIKIVKRQYIKIPKILAEFGGILNLIFIVLKPLLKRFIRFLFYIDLVNTFFIKKKNKKIDKSNNEGKINKIEDILVPNEMMKNFKLDFNKFGKRKFKKKIRINQFFQKKNFEDEKKMYNSCKNSFENFFDVKNFMRKMNEIELIKFLVTDINQQIVLENLSILFYDKKKTKIPLKEAFSNLLGKPEKEKIDLKLIEKIHEFNNYTKNE